MNYITSTGNPIKLATSSLGRGGEGEVFRVVGMPHLVAKIYHQPTMEHRTKLEFMVGHPLSSATGYAVTWPVELLFTTGKKPTFAGYLMPKLTAAKSIFTIYNPTTRRKEWPGVDYRHLVRCARNLAASFSRVHAYRHVIGDSNESNLFVKNDVRVVFIDVDSWQIFNATGGTHFPSPVAKGDFLPPELQNKNLKDFVRQPCHDNFALAVLLFKLLCEGSHPFDGIYHDTGDVPPVEARIAAGDFPLRDGSGNWSPKGLSLPFDALHPRLQTLFLQAFETGHRWPQLRPSAREWQKALTEAENQLHCCQLNSHHRFWGNECVWCQRKNLLGGLDPFPSGSPIPDSRTVAPAQIPGTPVSVPVPPAMPSPVTVPTAQQNNGQNWLDDPVEMALRAIKNAIGSLLKF